MGIVIKRLGTPKPVTPAPAPIEEVHVPVVAPLISADQVKGEECSYCGRLYMMPCHGKRYECGNRVFVDMKKGTTA